MAKMCNFKSFSLSESNIFQCTRIDQEGYHVCLCILHNSIQAFFSSCAWLISSIELSWAAFTDVYTRQECNKSIINHESRKRERIVWSRYHTYTVRQWTLGMDDKLEHFRIAFHFLASDTAWVCHIVRRLYFFFKESDTAQNVSMACH